MAKYLLGKNVLGDIISVYDLIDQPQESWGVISCVGCGELLVPKVKGKVMAPHFAHKALQECRGETYLAVIFKEFPCKLNNSFIYVNAKSQIYYLQDNVL